MSLDFAGFSAETLHGVLAEPLDKIRAGRLAPESITLRLLLPDTSRPMVLPCAAETLVDDPGMRERGHGLQLRQVGAIAHAAGELEELGLVRQVNLDVRLHGLPPLFKLFIVNDTDAFFGFYPIQRRTIAIADEPHDVFDLIGKDAVMFRYETADTKGSGAPFVTQARQWFDSVCLSCPGRRPTLTSSETAADLVARAQVVLLDFDGPICAVFAGYRAHEVAAQIMKHAANAGIALGPDDPDDPISVFKATTGMGPEAIAAVQDALVAEESEALAEPRRTLVSGTRPPAARGRSPPRRRHQQRSRPSIGSSSSARAWPTTSTRSSAATPTTPNC